MKNYVRILIAILALSTLNHPLLTALAQGTAFTYQGQLQNNGSPASGTYNLTFTLFATNSGGSVVAGPVTNSAAAISNGLFTVTIDFGSSVWNGQTNWMEIGVETNNAASFTTLAPRQQVTPAPYAIAAESLNGTIPASRLTGFGNNNLFVGPSGNTNTSGFDNTAGGANALISNTGGSFNTAYGANALVSNTTGLNNTADGYFALHSNTSGYDNTAVGAAALYENISGTFNIALGYQAGFNITTGSSNIDIGNLGLSTDTNLIRIGSAQTQAFIAGVINGNGSGLTNVSASQLTSVGNTNGADNFFVGPSGNGTTSGAFNTANGFGALSSNTSGNDNTACGFHALNANTSGSDNTACGIDSLLFNTNGNGNVAIGVNALIGNSSGSGNIAVGNYAGQLITTGNNNIDIGNSGVPGDNNIIRIGNGQDFDVSGTLNVNTGSYPGLTAFIRARQTDNLALAVQGFDSVNYLVVYTNGQVNISGNCYALSFNPTSDRNAKKDFSSVNSGDVLDKVAALPITEWQYKADAPGIQHLGPMAQDFHAAFGLNGGDDKHISVVDEGGVALAAIQGLNQKLEEKDAEIADLKARLDALEKIVLKQKSN